MKTCRKCSRTSDEVDFAPNRLVCKPCRRAYEDQWRAEHRERVRIQQREAVARFAEQHPDRVLANRRATRERYKERYAERRHAYVAANPHIKRLAEARRRARKRATTVVPITRKDAEARWSFFGGRCWMCRGIADSWDHVIPLAGGGWHVLSNLRPACRSCNSRKGSQRTPTAALRFKSEGAA